MSVLCLLRDCQQILCHVQIGPQLQLGLRSHFILRRRELIFWENQPEKSIFLRLTDHIPYWKFWLISFLRALLNITNIVCSKLVEFSVKSCQGKLLQRS